eukprot:CAMPEP_0181409450 /NCGR_PEP_ID=MMETSP1110-20121109/6824_1 /TAXON_ID=174948 /ORGANISM="Symbiodinium sp., Strain CCMP421" /LENGTH=32 /DNA_ID= /DNA_START= /DNA_END= /DNA_ORIENTATION=
MAKKIQYKVELRPIMVKEVGAVLVTWSGHDVG